MGLKVRVKATGEIVEVKVYKREHRLYIRIHGEKTGEIYRAKDLDFNIEDDNIPDYWTRLEHQAAIAAMGGICGDKSYDESTWEYMAEDAIWAAHVLVEKMKEESYGKDRGKKISNMG